MNRGFALLLVIGASAVSPRVRAADCDGAAACAAAGCSDAGHLPWADDAGACATPANPQPSLTPPREEDPGSCHCLWTAPAPVGAALLSIPLVVGGLVRRAIRKASR